MEISESDKQTLRLVYLRQSKSSWFSFIFVLFHFHISCFGLVFLIVSTPSTTEAHHVNKQSQNLGKTHEKILKRKRFKVLHNAIAVDVNNIYVSANLNLKQHFDGFSGTKVNLQQSVMNCM